jgi:NitT/TauT family transport system permease protein
MGSAVSTGASAGPAKLSDVPAGIKRRKWKRRWLEFCTPIDWRWALTLALAIWVLFFGLWQMLLVMELAPRLLLPAPWDVVIAFIDLLVNRGFSTDIAVSVYRIMASFAAACVIAVPLGILMGAFRAIDAFTNSLVAAWRYLPAPSFVPLLLMWLGTGELQKMALLFIGVLWFLITLIADHTKSVRRELIETALTLGTTRWRILWTVVVRAVLPDVVVSMRQMLAVSWTYLVIAEIIVSSDGIGAMMMRAKRNVHTDEIMAGILVIGLLGLAFDYLFRVAHRLLFPYLEDSKE